MQTERSMKNERSNQMQDMLNLRLIKKRAELLQLEAKYRTLHIHYQDHNFSSISWFCILLLSYYSPGILKYCVKDLEGVTSL